MLALLQTKRDNIAQTLDNALKGIERTKEDLKSLRDETFAAIEDIATRIDRFPDTPPGSGEIVKPKELWTRELLAQLARAEQASSALETHALIFDSLQVDGLIDQLGAGSTLRSALAAATDVAGFQQSIRKIELKVIGKNLQERLVSAVAARVAMVEGGWNRQRQEISNYFDEIQSIVDQASTLNCDIFHAALDTADVIIPGLKAMAPDTPARQMKLLEDYVAKGLHNVPGSMFAKLTSVVDQGKAMADKIRTGVASPAATVAGIARDLGAVVGDGEKAIERLSQQLDVPVDLSGAIPDAKLFGVLPLRRLLGAILRDQVPTIQLAKYPDHVEQVWDWAAPLEAVKLGIVNFHANATEKDKLRLHLKMTTRMEVPKPQDIAQQRRPQGQVTLEGFVGLWDDLGKHKIDPDANSYAFGLEILYLIDVRFNGLDMTAQYKLGEDVKPNVTPRLKTVEFEGPLQFVKTLAESFSNLGSGFHLIHDADRIGAALNLQLPSISFGAFSLAHLDFGVGLTMSLANNPLRFEFNVSTWEKPFELTVMCFGGRGFFRAALMTNGAKELEGALEFGGSLSFDVGVASGGLYVMAGAYFHITNSLTDLSGYLRAGGCLQVLGLIHASVEFLLMVSYRDQGNCHQLYGIAQITVSIDLFLFSADVTITMEKVIEGSCDSSRHASVPGHVLAQIAQQPALKLPVAYFERNTRHRDRIPGRFAWDGERRAIHAWESEYWSQFDFSELSPC